MSWISRVFFFLFSSLLFFGHSVEWGWWNENGVLPLLFALSGLLQLVMDGCWAGKFFLMAFRFNRVGDWVVCNLPFSKFSLSDVLDPGFVSRYSIRIFSASMSLRLYISGLFCLLWLRWI